MNTMTNHTAAHLARQTPGSTDSDPRLDLAAKILNTLAAVALAVMSFGVFWQSLS